MPLLQYSTWILFLAVFLVTLVRAVRQPLRANVDIAVLFAAPAAIVTIALATAAGLIRAGPLSSAASVGLLLAIPVLLLRLVEDFAPVSGALRLGAGLLLVLLGLGAFVFVPPRPSWYTLLALVFFVGLQLYVILAFWRAAVRATGVTRRRLSAAGAGALLLGLVVLLAALAPAVPGQATLLAVAGQLAALASGVAYFLAFATPPFLRRIWQEPEVRALLGQSARLIRWPDGPAALQELERAAAAALGAPSASLGLWEGDRQQLRFVGLRPPPDDLPPDQRELFDAEGGMGLAPGQMISGRVFVSQRAVFEPDLPRSDPEFGALYRAYGAVAALAAPITADDRRLGVLVVYAPRPPIFAADDLELVRLLANQTAVILESRSLLEETLKLRARAEAARLKDDFLSAAAHDLKTPVTAFVAQAHLMERRAARNPNAPADAAGLQRLLAAARRLDDLIAELLDAARAADAPLSGTAERVDFVALAREAGARYAPAHGHIRCVVSADGPVIGMFDARRIRRVLDHLVENAVKYSPDAGEVQVRVWSTGSTVHLTVADNGVGIPSQDLPHLFERFYRGTNVDDRRFAGLGLGLYLCQLIVQQHGGRIWATSGGRGKGSTLHLELPHTPAPALTTDVARSLHD